ncbi:sigma-70 family RNA polymerase sigma factor [Neobacillus rhizophilus]|uniref:Sigma-70 family RNA polymerase sigma factor n=1 Tax=Neobacillus rhizophilus TaxID=2833579 RepID=A0A942U9C3_9BACI|nr:sigma-70 family RNA polymerase sigma factor [Neobacillus rhizophilus]MBS4214973.1 sigma-70 family RNA polymerase sigma factor [Neobacillus rhizophilus]
MESFEQLAEQYQPMIHKIIHSLHLYTDLEEFYQLGLISLWEANQRFNPEKGNFTNYAYSYIRGKLLIELNKMAKSKDRSFCPEEEFWEMAPDGRHDPSLEKEILLSFLEILTPNQGKWLQYTLINGLSVREIAERESVTVSAVKQWREGARGRLKGLIGN